MKILLIEDSKAIAKALRRRLVHEYVLDLGLPDKDGLQVCRELRALGNMVPILV